MVVQIHRPQPQIFGKEECLQATAATTVLSTIVTTSMLSGVLDEIVALLPIVIPVSVGFIALRKGISFVLGMLRAA